MRGPGRLQSANKPRSSIRVARSSNSAMIWRIMLLMGSSPRAAVIESGRTPFLAKRAAVAAIHRGTARDIRALAPALREQSRACTLFGKLIRGVPQRTGGDRQATASNAVVESIAEFGELADAMVEFDSPRRRQPAPVLARRRTICRKRRKGLLDGRKRDAGPLRHLDDGDPPENAACIAPLIASTPRTPNQPLGLIEVQGRNRHATSLRGLSDAELSPDFSAVALLHKSPLDLKHG